MVSDREIAEQQNYGDTMFLAERYSCIAKFRSSHKMLSVVWRQ